MRRVVVTGLGMVSPLGCGVEPTWKRILNGESGARPIESFDVSDLQTKIACTVVRGDGSNDTFNADKWMEPKDQRKVDDFIIFGMAAAGQALDDANWHPETEEDKCATGTMIGSGIGGLNGIADTAILLKERGPRRVSPFFIPGRLINLASGYVSIAHGLKGPNHSVVTACSTGAHAVGDARPTDRARRCRRDGCRRSGVADQPHRHRRLQRGAGAVDRVQRDAREGLASLRQGP
ncbi:3-oxoacyl-(acyl-carrier-protein) synthase [Bradyrhizobium sp. USDA 4469]